MNFAKIYEFILKSKNNQKYREFDTFSNVAIVVKSHRSRLRVHFNVSINSTRVPNGNKRLLAALIPLGTAAAAAIFQAISISRSSGAAVDVNN